MAAAALPTMGSQTSPPRRSPRRRASRVFTPRVITRKTAVTFLEAELVNVRARLCGITAAFFFSFLKQFYLLAYVLKARKHLYDDRAEIGGYRLCEVCGNYRGNDRGSAVRGQKPFFLSRGKKIIQHKATAFVAV